MACSRRSPQTTRGMRKTMLAAPASTKRVSVAPTSPGPTRHHAAGFPRRRRPRRLKEERGRDIVTPGATGARPTSGALEAAESVRPVRAARNLHLLAPFEQGRRNRRTMDGVALLAATVVCGLAAAAGSTAGAPGDSPRSGSQRRRQCCSSQRPISSGRSVASGRSSCCCRLWAPSPSARPSPRRRSLRSRSAWELQPSSASSSGQRPASSLPRPSGASSRCSAYRRGISARRRSSGWAARGTSGTTRRAGRSGFASSGGTPRTRSGSRAGGALSHTETRGEAPR